MGGTLQERWIPVAPLFRFEALFLVLLVLSTGVPFAAFGWAVDPWPVSVALVVLAVGHHVRLGAPSAGMRRRPVVAGALVGLAVAVWLVGRGPLVQGHAPLVWWFVATVHWALLATGSDGSSTSPAVDRAAFVPLVLAPTVLGSLCAWTATTASTTMAFLAVGALLALAVPGVHNENLLFRQMARGLPAWLLFVLPLVSVLVQSFGSVGFTTDGDVLFDCHHASSAPFDRDLVAGDEQAEPPPGHGRLVEYVQRCGYAVGRQLGPVDEAALAKAAVFVVAMNGAPYTADERRALVDFVRRGGGLLVIGDHTDIDGVASAMNPLLEAFGVQFRFDTVWRRLDTASPDVAYLPHPLTNGLDSIYFSTGCSLDLAWWSSLRPFVMGGSFLFADRGNYGNYAYLGDSVRNADEPMGNLVLAVAGTWGRGRVVVLGDSAYLQNGVLHLNESFAARLFDWLHHHAPFRGVTLMTRAFTVLGLLFLAVVVLCKRSQLPGLAPLLAFGVGVAALAASIPFQGRADGPAGDMRPLMVVDRSHANLGRYYWTCGAEQRPDTLDVFCREIVARGWRLRFTSTDGFDRRSFDGARVLVIVHPRLPYTSDECAAVDEALQQGTDVLLFIGPEPEGGRSTLLHSLDLRADARPLGFSQPRLFAEQFPIEVPYGDGPWPEATVTGTPPLFGAAPTVVPVAPVEVGGGDVVARALGRPFVVCKTRHRGRVYLVGDRLHFTDYAFVDDQGRVDGRRLATLDALLAGLRVGGRP